jgi:peptidoglycan/LPS O-acetylase OafA/YrhL
VFSRHIPTLDGLRGFAAIWVVLNHLRQQNLLSAINGQTGEYGVILFFVLSGFLIGHLYLPEPFSGEKVWNYAVSRISRIVPMFYISIGLCYLASVLIGHDFVFFITPHDVVRLLTFNGSNFVFWSVAPEAQFYVFFVGIWFLFSRRNEIGASILPAVMLALALLLFTQSLFPGVILPSKLHIFLIGTMLAVIAARTKAALPGALSPIILVSQGLAVAIVLFLTFTAFIGSNILDPFDARLDPLFNVIHGNVRWSLLMAAILFVMAVDTPLSRLLLANRFMRLAGRYSFSIYLLHVPVIVLVREVTCAWGWSVPLQASAAIIMVAAIGPVAFYLVERPGQNRCRTLLQALRQKYEAGRRGQAIAREIRE